VTDVGFPTLVGMPRRIPTRPRVTALAICVPSLRSHDVSAREPVRATGIYCGRASRMSHSVPRKKEILPAIGA